MQRIRDPEEPDAVVPHVRICGGPGRATARAYLTPHCCIGWVPQVALTYCSRRYQVPHCCIVTISPDGSAILKTKRAELTRGNRS